LHALKQAMSGKQVTVIFRGESQAPVSVTAVPGDSLLDAAKRGGIALDAPCGGSGTCGKCRVKLLEGGLVSEASRHIPAGEFEQGWRLACLSRLESDVTVEVPGTAGAYRSRIKTSGMGAVREQAVFRKLLETLCAMGIGFQAEGEAGSGIGLLRAELVPPALDDSMADRERLLRKIAGLSGAAREKIALSLYALRRLPNILRQAGFAVYCVLRHERDGCLTVLDVFPAVEEGPGPAAAGLAVDIGTTTVSALLVNLADGAILASASAGNGQIRYGADVISRIIESGRPGGLERLRYAITVECLQPLIRAMCAEAGIAPDRIYRAAIAGNTTMTHLFMGVNPEYLRLEPYVPAFFETGPLKSAEMDLPLHPDAEIIIAPAVGSYVGGDITAGVFASMIFKKPELSLFIDLGTNGELVLGNAEFLMSCACSAVPAFEGGDISCGMRAVDGAIEACVINEADMEPEITLVGGDNQKPLGLCGSGLIDLIGELFRCGIIDARGKFIREGRRVRRDEWGAAAYIAVFAANAGNGRDIALAESDIDNFIRAKGAIFSAIRTMLAALDFPVEAVEKVYVAGGIGSGINIAQAVRIGMLPNLPPEKYQYIGNSSLHGAFAMLGSRRAAERVSEISGGMTYIELSAHPGYMDELVAACFLPHTNGALFERLD
jgi:uncharacterized 2Fe-2S/4Fe-4S cluster protein (DUF4445 family)